MTDTVNDTLQERGKLYGSFGSHAEITQTMKNVVRSAPSYPRMSPAQVEAVEMILHKIGRAVNGDPDHLDTWRDIAGYAELAARDIENS